MPDRATPPRDVFRKWADSVVPVEDPQASASRRERIVAATALAITRAAEERARTRRRLQRGAAWAAAATVLVGIGGAWRAKRWLESRGEGAVAARVRAATGSVRAVHAGESTAVSPSGDAALRAGDEVMTEPGGQGDVTLSDGVALSLDGASHLHLPEQDGKGEASSHEEVRFDTGTVHVRVPRLPAGHTFSIRTPDAEVTVHGTAFTVEVVAPVPLAPPATHVVVSEGVVSVASGGQEVRLTAGMQWSSPSRNMASGGPSPAVQPAPRAPAIGGRAAPEPSAHHPRAAANAEDVTTTSSLAEQNRLLAAAIDASRSGDDREGISILSELLRRFPTSPLAQEARVQRFRALERVGDRSAAAREARAYLTAYPSGFAREEAKSLVAVAP